MLIKINIRNGTVEVTSDTALMVKQDARDRQDSTIESVMGAIIASIGAEGNDTPVNDAPVNDAPVNDAPVNDTPVSDTPVSDTPVSTTSSQTVRTVGAGEVVSALKAMIEEKPQWVSRSAAAVAKFMGDGVDADSVKGALDTAVYNDDLSARPRRSGETVYSVN